MSEHVQVTTPAPGVRAIRLHRPDRHNALTVAMYDGMREALSAADADPEISVVILAGSDSVFTAGNDLADFQVLPAGVSAAVRFLQVVSTSRKPLLAAVEGHAVGIGTTMLLHCDLVYAGAQTRFRMPFVNLGLCPEGASSYLLPRLAGRQRAAELLLFGDVFGPEVGREIDLVNEITPAGGAFSRALDRAVVLAAKPPQALIASKALLRRSDAAAVADTLLVEGMYFGELRQSEEAQEAFRAFFEKRAPVFKRG